MALSTGAQRIQSVVVLAESDRNQVLTIFGDKRKEWKEQQNKTNSEHAEYRVTDFLG